MSNYLNADGLYVKLGVGEAASQDANIMPAGETRTSGDRRETVVQLNLVKLSTSAQLILNDVIDVPKNARIEEIEVEVVTAATSGGSATLDVGLIRNDRTTELDYDGFVAAAALATINTAGKRLNLINGSTAAGALIGTTLANAGLLVAKAGTAVFTAGVLRVRVKWFAT